MKELSLHILDLVQNSIRANADRIEIQVTENIKLDQYCIEIIDNGCGMDEETLKKAIDPYFTSRTTRKVGLGLSLFKQNAELTGGSMSISSEPGKGTRVSAIFGHTHLDRPMMGDIAGTIILLAVSNPSISFRYRHQTDSGSYCFDTQEIKEALGEIPLSNSEIKHYLEDMILENLKSIHYSN
ncbi:MAG: ATP-binding protein [Bacteroidota bacterium]|nr:ATP-binding protein [Bacteroidota bacterium]MDP4205067.1 ATP-binding protein [Bacteroidota bacterium]